MEPPPPPPPLPGDVAFLPFGYTASLFADEAELGQPQPQPQQQQVGEEEQQGRMVQVSDSGRLALLYHDQVYVFESVQPQTVQAILLFLQRPELPPEHVTVQPQTPSLSLLQPIVAPPNYNRLAALTRYREKRKNLRFEKKVTYAVRREVASRMKRKRGQFVSSSSVENSDDSPPPAATSDCQGEASEQSFCTNCGECRDATPTMRRTPSGSKSFCNACGLMWAKKSKLRKPGKSTSEEQEDAATATAPGAASEGIK